MGGLGFWAIALGVVLWVLVLGTAYITIPLVFDFFARAIRRASKYLGSKYKPKGLTTTE